MAATTRKYKAYFPIAGYIKDGSPSHRHINCMEVLISYNKGGINYFNSRMEKRGYYIHFTPCHRDDESYKEEGMALISTEMGAGFKMLVSEIKRDSQKAFEEALSYLETKGKETCDNYFPQFEVDWNTPLR